MNSTLRLFLIAAMAVYFLILILFVRRHGLSLKYSLLWIGMGIIILLLILFPQILTFITGLLGVYSEMNALLSAMVLFLLLLEISLTAICSRLNTKLTRMIQQTALLEDRIRELEAKCEKEREI